MFLFLFLFFSLFLFPLPRDRNESALARPSRRRENGGQERVFKMAGSSLRSTRVIAASQPIRRASEERNQNMNISSTGSAGAVGIGYNDGESTVKTGS